jgi:WD40 repeat protein
MEPVVLPWMLDFKHEMIKLDELRLEDDRLYVEKINEVENVFVEIKKKFDSYLEDARQKLLARIPKITTFDDEDWELHKLEFQNLLKGIKEAPTDQIFKKYLDKYIQFKRKCKKLKRQRDILRDQMTFAPEQLELSLKRIENSLERFANYYYQPTETSWEANDFNIKTLKVEKYIEGPGDSLPRSIEFIPNKNLLVIGDKQGHLSLWDSKTFKKYCMKNAHTGYINNLKYFAKRDWIISASSDGTIKVWETCQGPSLRQIQNIKAGNKYIWGILPLEKKGVLYSCGGEPNIKIWDLNNFKMKGMIETGEKERMGRDIVFIEKYNIICVGFQDGIIALYDVTDKTEVAIINTFNRVIISCIVFLEKENLLVAGTDLGGKIGTWKFKEQPESLYPEPEFVQEYKVGGTYTEKILPVNNEGQLLISTGSSSKITWLNLKKNTQKTSPSTKLEDCVGYALDPYGRRLVLGDYKSNKLAVLKY